MRAFSQLLDDLVYTRSRNTKLQLIGDYLKGTPDPDRGYGLAALTGTLAIPHATPAGPARSTSPTSSGGRSAAWPRSGSIRCCSTLAAIMSATPLRRFRCCG